MGRIVVCGGSVVGLAVAMMLARDGHEVTVLEGDPAEAPAPPVDAWGAWRRGGVAQFRQPHNTFARFRQVCDAELPGLTDRFLAAGCRWVDFLEPLPPTVTDRRPRAGDAALRLVSGRRPVVEATMATAAREEPGVTVRRGVRAAGLLAGPSALPGVVHVAGVRTDAGEELRADLVVDATGRRTRAAEWVVELGARPPRVEAEDKGFVYYPRFSTDSAQPERRGPVLCPLGGLSVLTLESDNDTWSVTVFTVTGDAPLKALRRDECFDRVVRACPLQAHWLDGEPLTGVVAMAGVMDRIHDYVVDGRPVVTGLAAVGDAWACTNPSAGRGLSLGLMEAQLLRQVVAAHLDDPATFCEAYAWRLDQEVAPYYRGQVRADRQRVAEMIAVREGREPPAPDPTTARFLAAAGTDADAFRAFIETVQCLALPQEVLARPAVARAVAAVGDDPPPPFPGPDRAALLRLLAA
jgi:2-polyprenyl-6-methoxyphenol hydroxylase-like FAD-dependent oxidoreductase